MSRSKRLLYDVLLDGGADGPHILRGPLLRDLEAYQVLALCVLRDFSPGGVSLSFGWAALPGVIGGVGSGSLTGAPAIVQQFLPFVIHQGTPEVALVTIAGGPLTDGQLELVLESVDL